MKRVRQPGVTTLWAVFAAVGLGALVAIGEVHGQAPSQPEQEATEQTKIKRIVIPSRSRPGAEALPSTAADPVPAAATPVQTEDVPHPDLVATRNGPPFTCHVERYEQNTLTAATAGKGKRTLSRENLDWILFERLRPFSGPVRAGLSSLDTDIVVLRDGRRFPALVTAIDDRAVATEKRRFERKNVQLIQFALARPPPPDVIGDPKPPDDPKQDDTAGEHCWRGRYDVVAREFRHSDDRDSFTSPLTWRGQAEITFKETFPFKGWFRHSVALAPQRVRYKITQNSFKHVTDLGHTWGGSEIERVSEEGVVSNPSGYNLRGEIVLKPEGSTGKLFLGFNWPEGAKAGHYAFYAPAVCEHGFSSLRHWFGPMYRNADKPDRTGVSCSFGTPYQGLVFSPGIRQHDVTWTCPDAPRFTEAGGTRMKGASICLSLFDPSGRADNLYLKRLLATWDLRRYPARDCRARTLGEEEDCILEATALAWYWYDELVALTAAFQLALETTPDDLPVADTPENRQRYPEYFQAADAHQKGIEQRRQEMMVQHRACVACAKRLGLDRSRCPHPDRLAWTDPP